METPSTLSDSPNTTTSSLYNTTVDLGSIVGGVGGAVGGVLIAVAVRKIWVVLRKRKQQKYPNEEGQDEENLLLESKNKNEEMDIPPSGILYNTMTSFDLGSIVGGVGGAVGGVLIAVAVRKIWVVLRKRKQQKYQNNEEPHEPDNKKENVPDEETKEPDDKKENVPDEESQEPDDKKEKVPDEDQQEPVDKKENVPDKEPPKVKLAIIPNRPYRYSKSRLEVIAESFHRPVKIEWMKDGHLLDTCKLRYRIENGEENGLVIQTLVISKVNDEDNGTYSAKATNEAGDSMSEQVELKVQGEIPTCEIDGPSEAQIGERVTFQSLDSLFHKKLQCIKWQKIINGFPVPIDINSSKYQGSLSEFDKPCLVINHVTKEDAVGYRLEVTYEDTIDQSNIITLGVEDYSSSTPYVYCKPDIQYGDDICLLVPFSQNLQTTTSVIWRRNGETINITEPKYMGTSSDRTNPSLHIRNYSPDDDGVYSFLYANANTYELCESSKAHVPPNIKREPPKVKLEIIPNRPYRNNESHLKIIAESFHRRVKIEWMKDGHLLDTSTTRYRIENGEENCLVIQTLVILKVSDRDNGIYSAKVTNEAGDSMSEQMELKVQGDFPKVEIEMRGNSRINAGDTIEILAKVNSSPDADEFTWFKERKKFHYQVDSNRMKYSGSTTVCGRNMKLVIQNASQHDEGQYQLRVTNKVGESKSQWLSIDISGLHEVMISGPTVVKAGDELELLGSVSRKLQTSEYIWMKDDQKIDFNRPHFRRNTDNDEPKILLGDMNLDDSGIYTLQVGTESSNPIKVRVTDSCDVPSIECENNALLFFKLLLDVGTIGLRSKLNDIVATQHFEEFIKNTIKKSKSGKGLCQFNKSQRDLLNPSKNTYASNCNEFDISTLYTLLRNNEDIQAPFNNWDKEIHPESENEGDDVERIKYYRNKLCHCSSLTMKTEEYNKDWLIIAKASLRLSDEKLWSTIVEVQDMELTRGSERRKLKERFDAIKEMENTESKSTHKDDQQSIETTTMVKINDENYGNIRGFLELLCDVLNITANTVEDSAQTQLIFQQLESSSHSSPQALPFVEMLRRKIENGLGKPDYFEDKNTFLRSSAMYVMHLKTKFNIYDLNFKVSDKCILLNTRISCEDQKDFAHYVMSRTVSKDFKKYLIRDNDVLLEEFGVDSADLLVAIVDEDEADNKEPQGPDDQKENVPDKGQMERPFLDEARFTADIHTEYDELESVVCLIDDRVWTCGDNDNNTMELLTIRGQRLSSVRTKSGGQPGDITVTGEGNLVYTDYTDRTINIVSNNKPRTVVTLQGWTPLGVCCTAGHHLLVTMVSDDDKQSKVVRYSGSTATQTIQFDDQGRPLYSSAGYISENRNLDICVADYRAVVVVNQSGKLRFRYTGHPSNTGESFDPRGIATDSQGHILIADYDNNRIHILDQDGQFLRYIHHLDWPIGLCVDSRDNLFVAELHTAKVKRIQYLESQR